MGGVVMRTQNPPPTAPGWDKRASSGFYEDIDPLAVTGDYAGVYGVPQGHGEWAECKNGCDWINQAPGQQATCGWAP